MPTDRYLPPALAGQRPEPAATPALLAAVADHLARRGAAALAQLDRQRLLDAWSATVEAFLDPDSAERRRLDGSLAERCRLSPAGLAAGLAAVLGGVRRAAADELFRQAADRAPGPGDGGPASPALIILASNLPALCVQPLLPALASRRPVILKSPSAEPMFAAAFLTALATREPALADALAAVAWAGGDRELEAPLLARCELVIAYGEADTLADLRRRARGRLVAYGPKTSLAVVSGWQTTAELDEVAAGLARDIALFDQRGCLSIAAVYAPPAAVSRLAEALAKALASAAVRLPPGPLEAHAAAAVQQLRGEAAMRTLELHELALAAGTVVVEPQAAFQPTPGLRTVRVHPLPDLATLPAVLAPWRDRLQGAALHGAAARALRPALESLGLSRCTAPGELQSPDATWHNGGIHPLAAFLATG